MARALEEAGFESAWIGDHVAMPRTSTSRYPFSSTGDIPWSPTDPWSDSVVALATMAEATSSIRIGTGVMVAALRNPVVLAKQLATIDVLSGGRLEFGVGAGWLAEEFTIVGLDPSSRGRRLDEAVTVIRRCWEGAPSAFDGSFFSLPQGSLFHPVPAHDIPVLVGGVSEQAYERVVQYGTGWVGTTSVTDIRRGALDPIARINSLAAARGRRPEDLKHVVRVHTGREADVRDLVAVVPQLVRGGVSELVVGIPWTHEVDLGDWCHRIREEASTGC